MLNRLGMKGFLQPQSNGPAYLDSVVASTVLDLDATIAASYPGSGTVWANLTALPADGSAQTAYDFLRGDGSTSSTYPTFNGSGAAAYWSFDGGDFFKLKSGANTAFLEAMHKTTGGQDFWLVITGQWTSTSGGGLFSTKNGNVPGIDILAYNNANGRIAWRQRGGSESGLFPTSPNIPAGTNFVALFTHSHTTNQSRVYLNTVSASETAHTFNTTTAAASLAHIGVLGSSGSTGNLPLPSGFRVYSLAMGNEYLNNTKVAAIIAHLNARHGRTYA